MAKTTSKSEKTEETKTAQKQAKKAERRGKKLAFEKSWRARKKSRKNQHKSFKRSYREDYARDFSAPGLLSHAAMTFQTLFRNWKLFLPLVLLAVFFNIILVGVMSEDTYVQFQESLDESSSGLANGELNQVARAGLLLLSTVTTGGLTQGMSEVQQVFAILIFVILWLVTIYLLRHLLAGHKLKLRDALYNALTPFLSTLFVLLVVLVELIPVALVVIAYSAAVSTNFLETPFYAFVFFLFAALMVLLSLYLVSSSSIALIAISAPGMYPLVALETANDLVTSRRIRWIVRLLFLVPVLAVVWVAIVLPLILLDLWLKSIWEWTDGIPFVSLVLLIMTCFSAIYATAYVYLFYRHMLNFDDETVENPKEPEDPELVETEKQAPETKPMNKARRKKL